MCRNMLFLNVKVKKVESRWTGSWVSMYSDLGFRPFRRIESYALPITERVSSVTSDNNEVLNMVLIYSLEKLTLWIAEKRELLW